MKSSADRHCQTFILKVAERCNLACDYCYMFGRADRSFRRRPPRMALDVASTVLRRIRDHAESAGLGEVAIALHGGEPLLVGRPWMTEFLQGVEDIRAAGLQVTTAVQTNGTLLDAHWLELFARHRVQVGISLDGPPEWNDVHRFDHAGRGSYAAVRRSIDLLIATPHAPRWGVLVVADPRFEGTAVYRHLRQAGVTKLDFLWPDFHHDEPPPWPSGSLASYFIRLFDAWYLEADAEVRIRWFESVLMLLAGGGSIVDSVGPQKFTDMVVESDGELQPLDSLRICGDAFTSTGINLMSSEVSALYTDPLYAECLDADERIADECRRCPVVDVCGGGLITHRWGRGNRFVNPSVHSADIRTVIEHIRGVLERDAPSLLADRPARLIGAGEAR